MAKLPSLPKSEDVTYEPKPSLQNATTMGLQAAAVGAFLSTLQNALGTHSHGASGFITRTGGTIGFFAAMGATFALTESIAANQRQKDSPINGVIGGCAAGFLAGIKGRSVPMALASCAVIGAAVGTYDYTGSLQGRDDDLDKAESKEEKRRKFFKNAPPPLVPRPAEVATSQ